MGKERVIPSGVEIHKPIPVLADPEQHGGAVQQRGKGGRPGLVGVVGPADDVDVPNRSEGGEGTDPAREILPLLLGGKEVEVEEVEVAGVVDGEEEAEDAGGVAGGAGEEVGEGGRRREGGEEVDGGGEVVAAVGVGLGWN